MRTSTPDLFSQPTMLDTATSNESVKSRRVPVQASHSTATNCCSSKGYWRTETPDSELIHASIDGDQFAFGELVKRHQDRLFASMLQVTNNADTAEEVVQDTFVQAYIKLESFRHEAAFSTWLFRIAFNKFLRFKKLAKRHQHETLEPGQNEEPVDRYDLPDQMCIRSEACESVRTAMKRLDAMSRCILELREMKGLSYTEIGIALGIKLGTVRRQLSRARDKLQREMRIATA